MSTIIVYTNDQDTLTIVNPAPSADLQRIISRLPEYVNDATIMTTDDLPAQTEYIDAWILNNGVVEVDMERVKQAHRDKLAQEALPLIEDLTRLMIETQAAGKDTTDIKERIEYLRTIPDNPDIDTATDLNDINAINIVAWTPPVVDTLPVEPPPPDERITIQNVIMVKKNPGVGEFSSLKSALDSITTSNTTNRYHVQIGPGIYEELAMTVPEYVSIMGTTTLATVIQTSIADQTLFTMSDNTEMSEICIRGHIDSYTTGYGFSAVKCEDVSKVEIHNACIDGFDIGLIINSSTVDTNVTISNSHFKGSYSSAIKNTSTNGFESECHLTNVYFHESSSVIKTTIINEGPNTTLEVYESEFLGPGVGGIGIDLKNGGSCNIVSSLFKNFDGTAAIVSEDDSGTVDLRISGTIFIGCTKNFEIQNVNTTGHFIGYSPKEKYSIISGSPFFIGSEDSNIITVSKRGSNYISIKSALDSITDSSETNPYIVLIGPGVFIEDEMTIPDYVSVVGSAINTTIIEPTIAEQHLFIMGTYSELSFMTLQGHADSQGSGYSAVYIEDVGDFAQMHKVSIFGFDVGITNLATTDDSIVYIEYVDTNECFAYDVKNISENGFSATCQLENFYVYESPSSVSKVCVLSEGSGADLKLHVTGFSCDGSGTTGILLRNGGRCDIGASFFKNVGSDAIKVENVGSGPSLQVTSTTFEDCTKNFNILNSGTTGYFLGYSLKTNHVIASGSSFFIANEDAKVIRVAKRGGDFTSIKSAVDSITDSSFYVPYMVIVGPGIYVESNIQMKTGIFLVGCVNGSVIIMPPNPSHTIVYGAEWSMINNFVLSGAYGPGGTAIYHTGTNGDGFLVRDCAFTANETNVRLSGNTALSVCVVDRCITSGNVKYAYICSTTNGTTTRLTLQNLVYQDLIVPVCEYFSSVSGTGASIIAMNCMLNIIATSSATGFIIQDGGMLRMSATSIRGFGKAIYVPAGGDAPSIYTSSTLIHDSTDYDILVEHPEAIGYYQGSTEYNKTSIIKEAPFNIFGKDQNVIIVAKKGGDFSSIKLAIDSISDASSTNRYVVKVGPGVYEEDTITLKEYVNIEGYGVGTKIIPTTSVDHHILIGSIFSHVSNILLGGARNGYCAVYFDSVSGNPWNAFTLKDVQFGDNDIHVKAYGDGGHSVVNIFDSVCGGINPFTVGFIATNNENNVNAKPGKIVLQRFNVQDYSNTNPAKFAKCYGQGCELIMNSVNAIVSTTVAGSCLAEVYDGGRLSMNAVTYDKWDTGIYCSDNGMAAEVNGIGVIGLGSNTEINIQHTDTYGSIQGSFDTSKVINTSDSIALFLSDPNGNGLSFNGKFNYAETTYGNLTDISKLITEVPPMGIIEGGSINFVTGFTISITSGYGYASPNNILTKREWSFTTLSVTSNANVYVYLNTSNLFTTEALYPDTKQNLLFGRIISNETEVKYIENNPVNIHHAHNDLSLMLRNGIGAIYHSGSLITEGSSARTLDITAGEYYYCGNKYTPIATTNMSWTAYYRSSTPGVFTAVTNETVVPNDKYDDGSGTLANLTLLFYTKHLIVLLGSSNQYFLIYGQEQVVSSSAANALELPEIPSFMSDTFVKIASIVVRQGTSTIVNIIDERPRIGFASSSTVGSLTDHSALNGLSNDDHPQYLLASGTRALTGTLDLGNNPITNVSNINGLDITTHASRHTFNGSDPLDPALVSDITELTDSTISAGVNNARIPRADHTHAHGNRGGGSLHAIATTSVAGFLSASDKEKLDSVSFGATSVSFATISPLNITKSTASIGTSTQAARADHKHDISTAAPSTTLTASTTNSEGSSTSLSRADHTHAISIGTPISQIPDQSNATGVATSLARSDHVHNIPTETAVPLDANSISSEGLASSFARSNHTHAISSSNPVIQTIAVTTQMGTSSGFARADHIHTFSTGIPVDISSANSEGSANTFSRSDHVHNHGNLEGGSTHAIATTSVAGFMSASDKDKLDGIEVGATRNNYYTVSSTASFTMNTNYTLVPSMTLTPGIGTYLVFFNGSGIYNSTSNKYQTYAVYVNSVLQSGTERTVYAINNSNILSSINLHAVITVSNDSHSVDIRSKINSGTGIVTSRTFTLLRVG